MASEPVATINVTTLKTPNLATSKVEISAPITPPRFRTTPHQAAVCGLKPDLAAINGVQLFKRYATNSRQKIANEAMTVVKKRPSVNSTMNDPLQSGRGESWTGASEAHSVSRRNNAMGTSSSVTDPAPRKRIRHPWAINRAVIAPPTTAPIG